VRNRAMSSVGGGCGGDSGWAGAGVGGLFCEGGGTGGSAGGPGCGCRRGGSFSGFPGVENPGRGGAFRGFAAQVDAGGGG